MPTHARSPFFILRYARSANFPSRRSSAVQRRAGWLSVSALVQKSPPSMSRARACKAPVYSYRFWPVCPSGPTLNINVNIWLILALLVFALMLKRSSYACALVIKTFFFLFFFLMHDRLESNFVFVFTLFAALPFAINLRGFKDSLDFAITRLAPYIAKKLCLNRI